MQDSHLLSTLQPPSGSGLPRPHAVLLDPSQASVVLRAIVGVQSVLAVAVMFEGGDAWAWFLRYAVLTAGSLPATLLWLVLCWLGLRRFSAWGMASRRQQLAFVNLMGFLCGAFACFVPYATTMLSQPHWLASSLSGAMLSGALTGLLVWRGKALQPSDSQGRLQELQARIRPHFLFNTLNSAIALVRAEPAKAESVLEDLSELFRAALRDRPNGSTLGQELALAQRYLAIEQIRFGKRLRVQWDLDPAAESARLPALILQPLVENAVHHGVEPSELGADIRISTQKRPTAVVIRISNTSPGGSGTAGLGMALANVRERLQLMHDLECDFRHGLKSDGYHARIEVPA